MVRLTNAQVNQVFPNLTRFQPDLSQSTLDARNLNMIDFRLGLNSPSYSQVKVLFATSANSQIGRRANILTKPSQNLRCVG